LSYARLLSFVQPVHLTFFSWPSKMTKSGLLWQVLLEFD